MPRIHSLLYILLLSLAAAPRAAAQIGEPRNNIAVGVSAGVAMNTIGFDPTVKQSQHMAPTLGLVARFTSEKYFNTLCALQLELNYTQLGWKEKVLDSNSEPLPDKYSRHQHYLQLPLLARLGWGKEQGGLMGYFLAGPQFGYFLTESSEQSLFTLDAYGKPNRPNGLSAQYDMPIENKFDYGITAGAGIEWSTKIGRFAFEARYYYGLSDIYKNSKKDVFGRSNNNTIVLKAVYLFDLK